MVRLRVKLVSENMSEVGYDPDSKTMEVVFNASPDLVYSYTDVPAEAFCRLLNAVRHGPEFAKSIKGKFKFTKLVNKAIK